MFGTDSERKIGIRLIAFGASTELSISVLRWVRISTGSSTAWFEGRSGQTYSTRFDSMQDFCEASAELIDRLVSSGLAPRRSQIILSPLIVTLSGYLHSTCSRRSPSMNVLIW